MTHKKLYDALIALYNKALNDRPEEWRYGQAVFNYALDVFPEETERLRGDKFDCFYNDDNIISFLSTIYYRTRIDANTK